MSNPQNLTEKAEKCAEVFADTIYSEFATKEDLIKGITLLKGEIELLRKDVQWIKKLYLS